MGGLLSLLAMIGGTAMQMKSSSDAHKRQQQAMAESMRRQREYQMQAEQRAREASDGFDPNKREQDQSQIAEQVEQNLIKPVAETQAANDINSRATGNVSDDYNTAKTAASLNQLKNAEALARLLGKTTSAARLRQGEAINMGNAASDINRINGFARRQYDTDQLGIASAGVENPWMQGAGQLLSNAGNLGMMSGGMDSLKGSIGKLFGGKGAAPIDSMAEAANNASRMWPAAMSPTQYTAATNSAKLWNAAPITY